MIAFDADEGDNAEISYSIVSERVGDRFKIHPRTGVIYSQKEFTKGMTYDLLVRAVEVTLIIVCCCFCDILVAIFPCKWKASIELLYVRFKACTRTEVVSLHGCVSDPG